MNISLKKGFSFGITSAIITTLGLMVGLESSTNSAAVVIGGIIIIAVGDALSDSLAMHISEESEDHHTSKEIWESTISTFIFKFIFASTFIVPVLLLPLQEAIIVSVIWGVSLICALSFLMARSQKKSPYGVIGEHMVIAVFVIAFTHYLGLFIAGLA